MVSNGNSKITLGTSVDPEYHLKKKRIGELRYSLPANSILVYWRWKRTHSCKDICGISWSSIQSKIFNAQQKIRGILNVFGVYDYINNNIWTNGYRKKTGKQFLDFIKRLDQKYDNTNIKQIFWYWITCPSSPTR